MHAYLKNYIEKDESKHEHKIGNYFVDIYNEEGIFEIQTKQLFRLRWKLKYLLKEYNLTVVFPIISKKTLFWLDPKSLAADKGRISPRKGTYYDMFKELYGIKTLLLEDNLSIRIILLEADELRLLNGWSYDKKRGSVCHDRIVTKIIDDKTFKSKEDFASILPASLPLNFSSKDLAREAKIKLPTSQVSLNILKYLDVVTPVSKKGNLIIYKQNQSI